MPYITLSGGLPLQVPTDGTRGWGSTLKTDTFQKIADHDHTTGKGNPITAAAISANAISGAAVRYNNDEYIRGRNQAGSGDINIIKVNTSDTLTLGAAVSGTSATLSGNVNLSGSTASVLGTTSDGSDNQVFSLCPGSAALTTRGAVITLAGNEHADAGKAVFLAGQGGGLCVIGTAGNQATQFYANNSAAMTLTAGGALNIAGLTASQLVLTDGSKNLVSSNAPTITGLTLSGLTALRGVYTDGSKALTSTIARTTWSPTLSGAGSLTIVPTPTINEADYWYEGPYIAFRVSVFFEIGGTPGGSRVKISAPVAGVADDGSSSWPCLVQKSGGVVDNGLWTYDGTDFTVKSVTAAWVTGASSWICIQGKYRAT